ncbi:hypothetical protein D3C84_959760 [compost metagenome]
MSTTNSNDNVVSHAINAAEACAEDSQSKQQVEQLSSLLQSSAVNASDEETSAQE